MLFLAEGDANMKFFIFLHLQGLTGSGFGPTSEGGGSPNDQNGVQEN
jgi:hypothetical protein